MEILQNLFPYKLRALLMASAMLKQFEPAAQPAPAESIVNPGRFDKLNVSIGNARVMLVRGDKFEVKAEASEKILKRIKIVVKNEELGIHLGAKSPSFTEMIRIWITLPSFVSLVNTGTAVINSNDIFSGEKMKIDNSGSGSVLLSLQSGLLDISVSGSGPVVLEGKADKINCSVSGSGIMDAGRTEARVITAVLTGSGTCDFVCKESLVGSITGSGTIRYTGQPGDVRVSASGSGKLIKK